MKSLLILRNIRVENANAITGMTFGFPAISNFLGFTHALSRMLKRDHDLTLGGCAVVCHQHHVQAYQPSGWGDYVFSLTRNPLTKEANSPAFVEEGRMHMEVTLVIECNFTCNALDFGADNIEQATYLLELYIQKAVQRLRLAGGTILGMRMQKPVQFAEIPESSDDLEKFKRKLMLSLLPGFVLVDRVDLLSAHVAHLRKSNPSVELIDAWLDFSALKYHVAPSSQAEQGGSGNEKIVWQRIDKPASGWLVPISTGYKAISPLYRNEEVANTRDEDTPFRFVETAYSIGQWISPHRVDTIEQLFWRYHSEGDWYLCKNQFQIAHSITETDVI